MTRLEELQAKLEAKRKERTTLIDEAQNLYDEGKVDEAKAKLEKLKNVRASIDGIEALIEEESAMGSATPTIPTKSEKTAVANTAAAVRACIKKLTNKKLTDAENALLLPTSDSPNGVNGEGFILPVDFHTRVVKKIREFKSIRNDIGYLKVGALSGRIPTDDIDGLVGLSNFADGTELKEATNIGFHNIDYALVEKAGFIVLSNTLLALSDEDLLDYVVLTFARRAIITENEMAFTVMAKDKEAHAITTHSDLTGSILEDIDPAFEDMVTIIVNQSGFKWMDEQVYADGTKVLKLDPATGKWKFGEYFVSRYSNRMLKNTSEGKAPVYYGAMSVGVKLLDLGKMAFDASAAAGFKLNATLARVIEFVDVEQFDSSDACYCYGEIDLTA